jgi:hypothetical protein
MGAEPLKDMLMSMRFRSKLDEKIHARQAKTNELENTITSVADSSEDGVELGNILRDASYGMLEEKTLKAITKLYEKWILKRLPSSSC